MPDDTTNHAAAIRETVNLLDQVFAMNEYEEGSPARLHVASIGQHGGVLVIADGTVYKRFLRNWDRVEAFTGSRRWISEYAMLCDWTEDGVRWQAENGNGQVQYDPIQPSMDADPEALLTRLAGRYFKEATA